MAQDGVEARRDPRLPAARRARRSPAGSASSLPLVRQIRSRGETLFQQHGRWISKHQIRTLLICSLVITSLFYPAVGIYFWASKGGPGVSRGDAKSVWRSLSTPFMDSFASSGRKHVNSLSDLRMIWDDARDLRAIDIGDAKVLLDHRARQSPPVTEYTTPTFARPRCQSIRVEHVFVTTDDVMAGRGPRLGVLENRILYSALQLQTSIESELRKNVGRDREPGLVCIQARPSFPGRPAISSMNIGREEEADCLTLSPLEYWSLDAQTILDDEAPAQLVAHSSLNRTRIGMPISPSTTLAGRWHLFKRLPRAEFLAFTFFLRNDDPDSCSELQPSATPARSADRAFAEHAGWHRLLTRVTGGQVRLIASPENISHSLVLQFAPVSSSSRRKPTHLFLLTAYAFIILYISRGLVNLRKVHSRFGLAFTGTIQLLISMITSVSICALLGIRLTLVPWELLPFVIVVVGSENMYSLTKAIVDTPLSLTVSSRIAHGLGKVGLPITLTTLADILLLLVITLFIGVRAVREFCVFAVFSLIMDWFLQMTFFVTILSIDMQRLELADLLTQGTRISRKEDSLSQSQDRLANGSCSSSSNDDADGKAHADRHQRTIADGTHRKSGNLVIIILSKVWNARTARTASLTLILVYLGGLYLYYGTGYPSHQKTNYVLPNDWDSIRQAPATDSAFDPYGHLDTNAHPALPWWTSSPSSDFWTSLNPLGAEELRIDVKPWTILSLRSSTEGQTPPSVATFAGWALFRPRIRAVVWFAKLVILPISGTSALLWMLLLYLLKDTELLDAQRDKSEADPSEGSNGSVNPFPPSSLTSTTTVIAKAHSCDIEFLVHDGGLAASVDNGGGIHIWRIDSGITASEDVRRSSSINKVRSKLPLDPSPVAGLAISAEAGWLAIGLASGRVLFLSAKSAEAIWDHLPADLASPITHLTLQHQASMHSLESALALSAHRDGTIRIWNVARKEVVLATSQTQLDSRLRWRSFDVTVPSAVDPDGSSSSSINTAASYRTALIGFTTSDGQFHIRAVEAGGASAKTVFTLGIEDRGQVCSALLCQSASRPPQTDETLLLRSTLILGFAHGRATVIDLETAEAICSINLDEGPVTSLTSIEAGDAHTSAFIARTPGRASLLVMASNLSLAGAVMEKSGSIHGSLSAFTSGSPIRIRTPNGSRTNAATFWADSSTPPSPANELGNPLSYPMSSHGSASRMRRASANTRDRSGSHAAAEGGSQALAASSSLSVLPSLPPPSNATQKADDRQLRLLGWIRCQRGGISAVGPGSLMVGVGRAQRGSSQSRWEWWALDLREELVLGRGGELIVPRQPLLLRTDEATSTSALRSSMQRPRTGRASPDLPPDDALSFSRLHPVHALVVPQRHECALVFGFGGSIGALRVKGKQS